MIVKFSKNSQNKLLFTIILIGTKLMAMLYRFKVFFDRVVRKQCDIECLFVSCVIG